MRPVSRWSVSTVAVEQGFFHPVISIRSPPRFPADLQPDPFNRGVCLRVLGSELPADSAVLHGYLYSSDAAIVTSTYSYVPTFESTRSDMHKRLDLLPAVQLTSLCSHGSPDPSWFPDDVAPIVAFIRFGEATHDVSYATRSTNKLKPEAEKHRPEGHVHSVFWCCWWC